MIIVDIAKRILCLLIDIIYLFDILPINDVNVQKIELFMECFCTNICYIL